MKFNKFIWINLMLGLILIILSTVLSESRIDSIWAMVGGLNVGFFVGVYIMSKPSPLTDNLQEKKE